jgi:uncharacterized membrane protein YfcA
VIPTALSGFLDNPSILFATIGTFLIAGTVKGVIGIGMPAICMVLLTLFLPPLEAIPLTAIPTMVVNLLQLQRSRASHIVVRKYGVYGITLLISIFLTGYFILSFPETLLLLVLGVAMVIFAVQSFAGLTLRFSPASYWQVICGLVTGFIGGLSSVFSPPIVMYLLGRDADKEEFIAATGFLFFTGCAPLVLALFLNGVLTFDLAVTSLFGLVVALAGFMIGEWIRSYLSAEIFRKLILLFFLVMGCRLVLISLI